MITEQDGREAESRHKKAMKSMKVIQEPFLHGLISYFTIPGLL